MARDLLIIQVSGPATMGAESFSNRGDIASNLHDLFVFSFFSSDLVNSSDTRKKLVRRACDPCQNKSALKLYHFS